MKKVVFALAIFFLCITGCKEQGNEVSIQFVDLAEQNMKIIPANPGINDEIKLVVFDDCTYNQLSGVTRKGNIINIQKQFNGMMKWPCIIRNDTILIGKIPSGTYNVNYTLIDIAQQTPQNISVSFTFQMKVAR